MFILEKKREFVAVFFWGGGTSENLVWMRKEINLTDKFSFSLCILDREWEFFLLLAYFLTQYDHFHSLKRIYLPASRNEPFLSKNSWWWWWWWFFGVKFFFFWSYKIHSFDDECFLFIYFFFHFYKCLFVCTKLKWKWNSENNWYDSLKAKFFFC